MSEMLENGNKFGAILVQVQDDLRELRRSFEKITVSDRATTLDIQALDNAITKTERRIRKHTRDYFKALTAQVLVLPSIKGIPKRSEQIPKWKPMHLQGEDLQHTLSREKLKPTLSMHLLCNPAHPKNRAIMYQKCEILLPDVHKKGTNAVKHHKIFTGPAKKMKVFGPRSHRNLDIHKEDKGTGLKSRHHKQRKFEIVPSYTSQKTGSTCKLFLTPKTPPPTTTLKSMDHGSVMQVSTVMNKNSQITSVPVPVNISKYPLTIINGRINQMEADFCHFKQSFSLCWSSVVCALKAIEKLLRDFAVPLAKVDGERLVEFAQGWDSHWRKARPVINLLSVLENWEEVLGLVLSPGQRYKGEGGTEAAAIHIQSCWRGYTARTNYLHHRRRRWAARTIAISWLMHTQMLHVRKALQARRCRQLENYRSRAQDLAANWKHIQSSKRIIIHIPSLGYSQSQRLNMRGLNILQNVQINRLCDIRDTNVEVIFICPQHLGEDILQYYTSLLQHDGATDKADNRATVASSCVRPFVVLTPEAIDYFPDRNMCLSTLLKYSPRTLKRIRNLIQGKQAYIVGGVAHVDDLAVADELGVPILGPEPAVAHLYSTKSGGRGIFTVAEVDVPPGQGGIYSLNQFQMLLAELMTQNLDVQRWLFKIDSEHSGRGTAYCDVRHLSCYKWALQEYHRCGPELWNAKWIQESVLPRYLDEIPHWLTRYARPAKTSCYPNWTCFLKTFLGQGGVVEAYPPSDNISCLTVDLLVEPGGEVTMLSCGEQLHGSCQLEVIGSIVPQTCVHPETLHSICTRVGQVCLQRCIVGYVSVDLATFLNRDTMEQKVWAIDVDLRYSDQLAMTQMLLMMTGGALNCSANCLEVPVQIREKHCEQQIADKPPVVNRFAVLGSHLFHSNLSMLYHNVFFKMCKAHGIGFNIQRKQGSVFALYDSSERCNIGMILDEYMRRQERIRTVSEDLQGALVTFARNLSVIHREISSSKMQEETNFKVLIKNIEDLRQRTVQRKLQAVKDEPAANCVFANFDVTSL